MATRGLWYVHGLRAHQQTILTFPIFKENFWAPVDVSWGYESRLGSIRLIGPPTSPEGATRLEVVRWLLNSGRT